MPRLVDYRDRLQGTCTPDSTPFCGAPSPFYCYNFARVSPGARSSRDLARHTGEIRYVFGNLTTDGQYDETDQVIADAMQSAWTAFARTGVPSVAWEAAWPAVDIRSPQYMSIEDGFLLRPYAANELTRLINSMRNAGDSAPETGFWKSRS